MTTRLREWRVENGWNQQEAADVAGITQSEWSKYERGVRHVPPRVRVQIARRLHVRVADLFDPEPILEQAG